MRAAKKNAKETYGDNLRHRRNLAEISLRAFARVVGVHPTYLSKIELGQLPPPSANIRERIERELHKLLGAKLAETDKKIDDARAYRLDLQLFGIEHIARQMARVPELRDRITRILEACAHELRDAAESGERRKKGQPRA